MIDGGICLITFSNNVDHQNVIYSMYDALRGKATVYTIGAKNPKSKIASHTEQNFYYDCPERPGIEKKTFKIGILFQMVKDIKAHNIKYLYFESLHIWNAFLMCLCPRCVRIEAIHDVIPHDGNRAMDACNYVTSHLADHVVLRNFKYKDALSQRDRIPVEKITCIRPWRAFPEYQAPVNSKTFLYFGRIRKYKGFDRLFDIIQLSPNIHYRVVGEPDEESKPIVEQLKQLPNVDIVDREVDDNQMFEEFKKADWVVLPYKEATQSGVILDACRCSRPVIAFDVGAISEQIEDGHTGFLIKDGDVNAFAQKVEEVSQFSSFTLSQFSKASYQFGYERYSADAVSDILLDCIRSLS